MRISLFEIEGWERDALADVADEHDVRFVAEPLSAENAGEHEDAEIVPCFITRASARRCSSGCRGSVWSPRARPASTTSTSARAPSAA